MTEKRAKVFEYVAIYLEKEKKKQRSCAHKTGVSYVRAHKMKATIYSFPFSKAQ